MATTDPWKLPNLLSKYLRMPEDSTRDAQGDPVYRFDPPLSPAEQATLTDLRMMSVFGVDITLAEFQNIKPLLPGLKSYLDLPDTGPDRAAIKALIRVVATIARS